MFGLFKKKSQSMPDYQVFISEVNKYRHIIHMLKNNPKKFVVIYHFDNTGDELRQLLNASKVSFSQDNQSDKILLMSSKEFLNSKNLAARTLVVVEIHPLPEGDSELMKIDANNSDVQYFAAIDSPFFKLIGGNLQQLIQKLGDKPDEIISHTMVSKSIMNVQKKILAQIQAEMPETESIEKWIEVNKVKL